MIYVWYADIIPISTMIPTFKKEIDCTYIWPDIHLNFVTGSL